MNTDQPNIPGPPPMGNYLTPDDMLPPDPTETDMVPLIQYNDEDAPLPD